MVRSVVSALLKLLVELSAFDGDVFSEDMRALLLASLADVVAEFVPWRVSELLRLVSVALWKRARGESVTLADAGYLRVLGFQVSLSDVVG